MEQGQRVKAVRKELGMTLDAFGKRVGVTKTAISNIENGARCLTDQMLLSICREFGVNETWLRTGAGEPFMPPSRSEEMGRLVKSLMADKPEAFRSRLITALLRFDADGPEWQLLEDIYNSVAAEADENNKETDL